MDYRKFSPISATLRNPATIIILQNDNWGISATLDQPVFNGCRKRSNQDRHLPNSKSLTTFLSQILYPGSSESQGAVSVHALDHSAIGTDILLAETLCIHLSAGIALD